MAPDPSPQKPNPIVTGPIVRFVSSNRATVWLEMRKHHSVVLHVTDGSDPKVKKVSDVFHTTQVGTRFFVMPYIKGLKPSTIYKYRIEMADVSADPLSKRPRSAKQLRRHKKRRVDNLTSAGLMFKETVFRTLPKRGTESLELAFGSCRKWRGGADSKVGADAMALYAQSLREREPYPHLMLLLGDQIYADDVSPEASKIIEAVRDKSVDVPTSLESISDSRKKGGINKFHLLTFTEFGHLYSVAWNEPEVRKLLANIPTFMIFDDHEITDDWNISGSWYEQMRRTKGWTSAIVDGLAAYWVYQGWGNIDPLSVDARQDPRIRIMEEHERSGKDALPALRELLRGSLDDQVFPGNEANRLKWYYDIPTSPPIFVMDARNDRVLHKHGQDKKLVYASRDDLIVSERQLKWLEVGIAGAEQQVIVVSGVPYVLPKALTIALLMASRPKADPTSQSLSNFISVLANQSPANLKAFEGLRRDFDFDQWPAFPKSFYALTNLLNKFTGSGRRRRAFIFLSGDVHFSYAIPTLLGWNKPKLFQLVSSPLKNQTSPSDNKHLRELMLTDVFVKKNGFKLINRRQTPGKGTDRGLFTPDFHAINPKFNKPDRLIENGILVGNSMARLMIRPDRKTMDVHWYNAGTGDTELVPAVKCTYPLW